jgi:hypothetical protein
MIHVKRSTYGPEYLVAKNVAYYLRMQYPKVIFHFDPTGNKLTKAQAGMMKAIQGGAGFPDLFICEPRGNYSGLFLELKAEGVKIKKGDGVSYASDHVRSQADMLERLRAKGYYACFAVGFDEARNFIDAYMNFKHGIETETIS